MQIYDDSVLGLNPTVVTYSRLQLGNALAHIFVQRIGVTCYAVIGFNGDWTTGVVDCNELNCFYCEYILAGILFYLITFHCTPT